MNCRRAAALGLLAATWAMSALGQYYFAERREYLWDGLVFHALAALSFLLAWRVAGGPHRRKAAGPLPRGWAAGLLRTSMPSRLLALALCLSAGASALSRRSTWDQTPSAAVILWLLGLVCACVAAAWPSRPRLHTTGPWRRLAEWRSARGWQRPGRAGDRWGAARAALVRCAAPVRRVGVWLARTAPETRLEAASLAGLTLAALLLRATALGTVPYTLAGDEAWFGLTARQVLRHELRNPFVTAHLSMPTLFYWPVSWALRWTHDPMVGLRLPAALVGTVSVPALYWFAKHLWGRPAAFLSAAFLATYDYHIHYSRLGLNNVWDPVFAILSLWALESALSASEVARARRSAALAGLAMGAGLYFYTGARLIPVLAGAYTAAAWLGRRRGQAPPQAGSFATRLAPLAVAFLVAAGPMLAYALGHPDEWNARINQVGILQSGWLAREPGLTGHTTAHILADQFLRAAGTFHVFPDRTAWYGADRPLLGAAAGIFAILGLAWAAAHIRQPRWFLVLFWFWTVVIAGGMLTESPPSSQRLVLAIPAVCLLVAAGIERAVCLAGRLARADREWINLALGVVALLLAASNVRFYFAEYIPSGRFGSENGETATQIGHFLADIEGSPSVYFFGAPRIYWSFGSMAFLAPEATGQDVVEALRAPPEFADVDPAAVFVFLPERAAELTWVQSAFPSGQVRQFRNGRGRPSFLAYLLQPAAP